MVGFVSFQVIPHRTVGRLRVLDLWLGRSRSMEELMIPFLCACLIYFSLLSLDSWITISSKMVWGLLSAVYLFS